MSTRTTTGVWIVYRNDDLTEGRGHRVECGRFSDKRVAESVARKIDTQGSNGRVEGFVMPDIPIYATAEEWLEGHGDRYARQVHRELLMKEARESLAYLEELHV